MPAWDLQTLIGLTNSTQRFVNTVKSDTLTSINSELPTAASDWLNTEPRTRFSVSINLRGLLLVFLFSSHGFRPKLSFLSPALHAAVFSQVGSKTLSDHSCFILAKFLSSQQGFVAMEEIKNTCQMILLGYSATPCIMQWSCFDMLLIGLYSYSERACPDDRAINRLYRLQWQTVKQRISTCKCFTKLAA